MEAMINDPTRAPYASPSSVGVKPDARLSTAFLTQAFAWMFAGLMLTAVVSATVAGNPNALQFAQDFLLLIIIAQLALVVVISGAINKISATVALGLFFVYAASVGLSVGLIVAGYTTASVAQAFVSAAAMFGGAAIYGAVTKRSLASMGGILTMGLIGLIAAMIVNLFLHSSAITWLISIAGIGIFTALTARDVQRIQAGDMAARLGSMEKAAVMGALTLYLDFLNLFLFFLRLMGGRN
jgi:FtsH-binding integral membrane protein